MRMLEQGVKHDTNHSFEQGPEAARVGGNGLVCKQGGHSLSRKRSQFPVNAPVHFGVQAELIAKVLKDQALVVARLRCDSIDPRAIEAVFREDFFRRVQNSLPRPLCVMHAPSSTLLWQRRRHRTFASDLPLVHKSSLTSRISRLRHPFLISFAN